MAVDLFRNVNLKGLNPDAAALVGERLRDPHWTAKALRRLKARRIPWRSWTAIKNLGFRGTPLWPSQRKYIADKIRDLVRSEAQSAKGRGKSRRKYRRELHQQARELREWLRSRK